MFVFILATGELLKFFTMSSKDPNLTSLAKYVYRRLKNDENVSPKVVFADFSVLYGTVCSTTPKTVSKLIASFKNGDKSSLEKGPFFPLIKTEDFQLPEKSALMKTSSTSVVANRPTEKSTAPLTTTIKQVAEDDDDDNYEGDLVDTYFSEESDTDSDSSDDEENDKEEETEKREGIADGHPSPLNNLSAVIEREQIVSGYSPKVKRSFILYHYMSK